MHLPILYKRTAINKIQQWGIKVGSDHYHTEYGHTNGKITIGPPVFCSGKNKGKANETSVEEQARFEARSRWESQKKKGYVESLEDAKEGKVDPEFVVGGYKPMLAAKFRDHSHKIKYPCYGQPKLDGHRGVFLNGKLYSRTQKPITSCPHIEEALSELNLDHYPLDGELYNHEYKDEFETLSSAIRKKDPLPPEMHHAVQYHLYDLALNMSFENRKARLAKIYDEVIAPSPFAHLFRLVPTEVLESEEEVFEKERYWRLGKGYEGYMVRNADGMYRGKRSPDLQKVKVFQDEEFKIVGIKEGKGKLRGHVGAFICEIDDEHGVRTFEAKPKGKQENLKAYFEDHSLWEGQWLTVEFLNYTQKNKVPRHGIGIRFRDREF